MTFPQWLKPGIYGAVAGAALAAIIGFSWGGWMTSSAAEALASDMAHDEVIAALVPVCVDLSMTDPDRAEHIAAIQAANSFQRRETVIAAGWATMPGSDTPNRDLALACVDGLDLDAS